MIAKEIESLIQKISRLPGLGPRSARRIVIHLLQNKEKTLAPLISALQIVSDNIKTCPECSNIDVFQDACNICSNHIRLKNIICIVESVSDLWAIEKTRCFNGHYHIIGGLLSSMNNLGPEVLMLEKLSVRCKKLNIEEIIIALPATIEGQTTDHYIRSFFKSTDIKITTLAHGIPMGGELDYLDDGTLFAAFSSRK